MPNYNGTGPVGDGPMTGGGQGYCIQPNRPGLGQFGGRRLGRRGAGRFGMERGARGVQNRSGRRNMLASGYQDLVQQINQMQAKLDALTEHIDHFPAKKEGPKEGDQ